jgi:two-component system chemotaxis response regulator CheY
MKNVLVVDDSRIMRNIVKNTFDTLKIPCAFFEASNGKDALKSLIENKISIVFLDWNMPEMDGLEFLKAVRKTPSYESLPIIMVTSESAKYNVIEALENGATDYIIKPVHENIFREKVQELTF